MPTIKVYHNSHFLDYRGDHNSLIPPLHPIATVRVPPEATTEQALETAYRLTQHVDSSWWQQEAILLHARSTSVGDILEMEDGEMFVVESMGFRPYLPLNPNTPQQLVEVYRWLAEAFNQACHYNVVVHLIRLAQIALSQVLAAEGIASQEEPLVFTWNTAQPGDLVGSPEMGLYRVIARKLRPKWRAKRLLVHIPTAQIWIDSPQTWAVLIPIQEEVKS